MERSGPLAFLQLVGAWTLAVVFPFLHATGRETPFYIAHGATGMRLVVFVVVATLLPPLVAFCAYLLLRRLLGQVVAGRALTATLAGLIALIALPLVARGPLGSPLGAAIVAVLTSAGAFAILVGSAVARRTLALCAAVAPLALLQFLAFSPARELLSARSGGDTTRQVGAVSEKPPATPGRSPPTVVLVVFDELPVHALEDGRGGIDRSRFPAFHGLARVATWYRFASSPGSDTYVAVPALVTGLPPDPDRAPVAASYPSSLFTRLRGSYRLFAEEPETVMCALPECERSGQSRGGLQQLLIDSAIVVANLISPPGLRDRLPRVDQTYQDFLDTAGGSEAAAAEAGRDDEGRLQMKVLNRRGGQALGRPVSAFRAALQALPRVARERPLFAFLHIELPHVPWQYFPDLGRYRAEPLGMIGILGDRWGTNQSQIDQERPRFLFQTGAADAGLGAIVARLRALGLWDRSLVVVTADHGSAFTPGRGRRTPTSDNFAEIAGVPLFVKWPRQKRGRVENGPASTLDIPPTVLAVAGLKADGLAGSDLRRGIPRRTRLTLTPLKGKKVSLSFATFMRQRAALAHAWRRFANGGWERVSTAIAPPALKAAAAAGQARRADALGLRILSLRWRRIGRTPPSPPDRRELRRAQAARRTGAAVVLNVEVEHGPARLRWIGVVAGNRLIGAAPVYEWLGRRFASITSFGAPVSTRQLRNLSFVVR